MRAPVFALMLLACSDEAPLAKRIATPTGPIAACVALQAVVAHLETCVKVEDFRYPDIAMTKSSLAAGLQGDRGRAAEFCRQADRSFREEFASCLSAEATTTPGAGSPRAAPMATVPFDATVLGARPHPFGGLDFLRAYMTRDEIVATLAFAATQDRNLEVPLGIEGVTAGLEIDFAGTFDIVRYRVPADARDVLVAAWGKPAYGNTWFDPAKRWRADLNRPTVLMVGPYVPFIELIGAGPDGLSLDEPLIGQTRVQLERRFAARFDGEQILIPVTNVCMYYPKLYVELANDRVTKLRFEQCYDDAARAKAAIAWMKKQWGEPVTTENGLRFSRPGRTLELVDESRLIVTITPAAER